MGAEEFEEPLTRKGRLEVLDPFKEELDNGEVGRVVEVEVEEVEDVLFALQKGFFLAVEFVQSPSLRLEEKTHDEGEDQRVHLFVLIKRPFCSFLQIELPFVLQSRMVVQVRQVFSRRTLFSICRKEGLLELVAWRFR